MTALTEETAQSLLREVRKANALQELAVPLYIPESDLVKHYQRSIDWIKAEAARLIGYKPRRGVDFRLTRAQVLRLDYALEAEAAAVEASPPGQRRRAR